MRARTWVATPALAEYLDGDPRIRDACYMHEVYKALGRVWKLMQFDPERVGRLASPEELAEIEGFRDSLAEFVGRIKRTRGEHLRLVRLEVAT